MARVPGLSQVEDQTDLIRRRQEGRVEVDPNGGVQTGPLRPVAAPVNTYARPAQPARDDRLTRLADALGALNTGLQQFGSAFMAKKRPEDVQAAEKAATIAANRGQPIPREELLKYPDVARKAGELRYDQLTGGPDATRFTQKIFEEYNNLPEEQRRTMDIDQFLGQRLKTWQEENLDKSAPYLETFTKNVQSDLERFKNGHFKYVKQAQTDQADTAFQQFAFDKLARGFADGRSPEEVMAELRKEYKDNKDFARLDFARQDKAIIAAVTQFAGDTRIKGKEAFVDGFLKTERVGDDGTKLGNLQSRLEGPSYNALINTSRRSDIEAEGPEVAGLLTRARQAVDSGTYHTDPSIQKEVMEAIKTNRLQPSAHAAFEDGSRTTLQRRQEESRIATEKAAANALASRNNAQVFQEVDTMVKGGRLHELPTKIRQWNEEGGKATEKEVDVNKYLEDVYAPAFEDKIAQQVHSGAITADEGMGKLIDFYASGPKGFQNKRWENFLRSGYVASNAPNLTAEKLPDNVETAFKLYKQLDTKNRKLLEEHLPKEQLDWYDNVNMAMEYGLASNPKDAMIRANMAKETFNKDPSARQIRLQEIEKKAKETGNLTWGWDGKYNNLGYVQTEIARTARALAPIVDDDTALKKAREIFDKTHVRVNNMAVKVTDKNTPPWYAEEAERYIQDYVTRYKDDRIESVNDVGFFEYKGQVYLVGPDYDILGRNGPTKAPPGRSVLTVENLRQFRQERLDRERKAELEAASAAAQAEQDRALKAQTGPRAGTPEWEIERRRLLGLDKPGKTSRGQTIPPSPAPVPTGTLKPGTPEWEAQRQRIIQQEVGPTFFDIFKPAKRNQVIEKK